MKIEFEGNKVSTNRVRVKASTEKVLVLRATDCEVDTSLGRITITCKGFSVSEKNQPKDN